MIQFRQERVDRLRKEDIYGVRSTADLERQATWDELEKQLWNVEMSDGLRDILETIIYLIPR